LRKWEADNRKSTSLHGAALEGPCGDFGVSADKIGDRYDGGKFHRFAVLSVVLSSFKQVDLVGCLAQTAYEIRTVFA